MPNRVVRGWVAAFLLATGCASGGADGSAPDSSDGVELDVAETSSGPVCPVTARVVDVRVGVRTDQGPLVLSLPVAFDVPSGARSILLTATEPGSSWTTGYLVNPEGRVLVPTGWYADGGQRGVCLVCDVRVTAGKGRHSVLIPTRPGTPLPAGSWAVQFERLEGDGHAVDVTVEVESGGTGEERRWLAVELLVAGQGEITADQAAVLEVASRELEDAWGAAGIDIVTTRREAPELPLNMEASDVAALAPTDGIAIVLVGQILGTGETTLYGLSPTPGPASGGAMVIRLDSPDLGRTMAHELGHYLGLFHLTEPKSPDIHDPIADTPISAPDNVMDVPGDGVELTEGQRAIANAHPASSGVCETNGPLNLPPELPPEPAP